MKWIKKREKFLNEAKIRDVILPRQAKAVIKEWSEKYLDYEEVEPTDKIKQGKWKLDEDDKNKVLSAFFDLDEDGMKRVFQIFESITDKFAFIINQAVDLDLITNDKHKVILKDFDIKSPTIDQMVVLFDNIFKKLDLNATRATEMIQKDENGRPIRDEEGNMIKVQKEAGDPIFSTNLVNINTFVGDYNRCYPDDQIPENKFNDRDLNSVRNLARDQHNDYKSDFEIFNKDIYLSISHNARDILNMSISKFYASCQHLYGGGYRSQVLGNVFDPNSIPAFLIFETPLFWDNEKISDTLPLTRMMIRNLETFDETKTGPRIFFDRAYPDRMKDVFGDIVEKYSGNIENTTSSETYYWTPDIDLGDKLTEPYMDRLRLKTMPYIGVNTRTLHLNRNFDWSKVKVSPKAKVRELIIETPDIPDNLLEIDIELEWIKFKYLSLNTLSGFDKIKTDSVAFDKCKFKNENLVELIKTNEGIKKLQIVSCDANNLDFSLFTNLDELHLIYTLDSLDELKNAIKDIKLNRLVISGDLVSGKEGKAYLNELKRTMKVEIIGPVI